MGYARAVTCSLNVLSMSVHCIFSVREGIDLFLNQAYFSLVASFQYSRRLDLEAYPCWVFCRLYLVENLIGRIE